MEPGASSGPPATPEERALRVKAHAKALGFDRVGIAPPNAEEAYQRFETALGRGYLGEMAWLLRDPERRADARRVWSATRSVVVVAVSYASDAPGYLDPPLRPDEGYIARYAQGRDYHEVVKKLLIRLAKRMAEDPLLGGRSTDHRCFVDAGPVLEKAFAARAGLGWIGKNSLLLNQEGGSWYFLGVLLTPLELAPDLPETDHCGSCRRCLDACPTSAFPEPYVLDATRCIAYWTIESPEPARDADPERLGQHLFGCDICQEVCPWNRRVEPTRHAPLLPRPENQRPSLESVSDLDEPAFHARFPRSAVRRTDARRWGQVVTMVRRAREGT
jgi:epoxyqueuosine reductase